MIGNIFAIIVIVVSIITTIISFNRLKVETPLMQLALFMMLFAPTVLGFMYLWK